LPPCPDAGMSVNERRNAKRRLRRQVSRIFGSGMSKWLWRADTLTLTFPSADNPYGGLDAKGVKRAARQYRKKVAPLLDDLPGFLRLVAERVRADAVAQHGKIRRPGPRRRWPSLAFTRGPMERIDALVAEGVGPKKAAEMVAHELPARLGVSAAALFQSWS